MAVPQGGAGLSRADLARAAGVDEAFVGRLTDLAILVPRDGRHVTTDVYLVRFAVLVERSGIDLEALARAVSDGIISLGDVDAFFPHPVGAPEHTHAQLATELGVEPQLLHETRLAAGLVARDPDDLVRQDEERALRSIVMAAAAFGDPSMATRLARVFGASTQRISAAAVRMYDESVSRDFLDSGAVFDERTNQEMAEQSSRLMDIAEDLLITLYGHHLEAATLSSWLQTTEILLERHGYVAARPTASSAIAFVDISGFTSLTEKKGDEVGTRLAGELATEAERAAAAHGGRIVKLLGDGVMLHGDDPIALVRTVLGLVGAIPARRLPPAHAGVHAGPIVERDGDYFGRTVNIAARIAAEAGPGEVLVSDSVVEGPIDGLHVTEIESRPLRGVSRPMRLFRVEGEGDQAVR